MKKLLYGTGGEKIKFRYENDFGHTREAIVPFEGIVHNLERRYRETGSDGIRDFIEAFMSAKPCEACNGDRLKPESFAVTINEKNIAYVTRLSIGDAKQFFRRLDIDGEGASDCSPDPEGGSIQTRLSSQCWIGLPVT